MVNGADGDDTLRGSASSDLLDGGEGNDTIAMPGGQSFGGIAQAVALDGDATRLAGTRQD